MVWTVVTQVSRVHLRWILVREGGSGDGGGEGGNGGVCAGAGRRTFHPSESEPIELMCAGAALPVLFAANAVRLP